MDHGKPVGAGGADRVRGQVFLSMAGVRSDNLRAALQRFPNRLLRPFLNRLGVDSADVPWEGMRERAVQPLLEFLRQLPVTDLERVEGELQTLFALATETGLHAVLDAGRELGDLTLPVRLPPSEKVPGKLLWVWLHHPAYIALAARPRRPVHPSVGLIRCGRLDHFRLPNHTLATRPTDGVEVTIRRLSFGLPGSKRRVDLQSDPDEGDGDIHAMIRDYLHPSLRLEDLQIMTISLAFEFLPMAGREAGLVVVSLPTGRIEWGSEVTDFQTAIIRKYLQEWNIDVVSDPDFASAPRPAHGALA